MVLECTDNQEVCHLFQLEYAGESRHRRGGTIHRLFREQVFGHSGQCGFGRGQSGELHAEPVPAEFYQIV